MKLFSSEVALYIYESTIRSCIEYSCHGAPNCYLAMLGELQKWAFKAVDPKNAASLESFS